LKSNSLTIEAEASKASTAKLLNDDRMSLEHGLRDAGYDVSSLKISDVSASGSSNSSGWLTNGSPAREGDQARSGFTSQQDGQMQRRDGSTSDQASRRQKDERPQSASGEPTGGRTSDAVYI
ncbi:MAG: flagellar hook-length control protein FliK, partial [Hyphomicrobium sp.]